MTRPLLLLLLLLLLLFTLSCARKNARPAFFRNTTMVPISSLAPCLVNPNKYPCHVVAVEKKRTQDLCEARVSPSSS